MLELLISLQDDVAGSVVLRQVSGKEVTRHECSAGEGYFRWLKLPLKKNTNYCLQMENIDAAMAYLSGCVSMPDCGICYLRFGENELIPYSKAQLYKLYEHPYREQYHFAPVKNWGNDPNGLCWFNGYYHLFYQANPYAQVWGNMYWGHAASKDLIHWVHQPLVFEPQQSLGRNRDLVGGAFSGSALPVGQEVYIFMTRSEEVIGGEITSQYQVMCKTDDMIHFSAEEVIIPSPPQGATRDFRDPKVFARNGRWYMVLGGGIYGKAAVFLYESQDLHSWNFRNVLLTVEDPSVRAIECPDCFYLDGKYVVIAAWMKHTDEFGRFQMTRYYIGHFEGDVYVIENEDWFDFGSNCYAVQSFEKDGQRIAIGWVSDFYGEHQFVENGVNGSYTIPRVLHVVKNKLTMEPVPQIDKLHSCLLYHSRKENLPAMTIKGNSYHCRILLEGDCDFNILVGKQNQTEIRLIRENGETELKTSGVVSEGIRFVSGVKEVSQLDLYVDRRLVEVFINGSEVAGSKVFYTNSRNGVLEAVFSAPEAVASIELYQMESIWKDTEQIY